MAPEQQLAGIHGQQAVAALCVPDSEGAAPHIQSRRVRQQGRAPPLAHCQSRIDRPVGVTGAGGLLGVIAQDHCGLTALHRSHYGVPMGHNGVEGPDRKSCLAALADCKIISRQARCCPINDDLGFTGGLVGQDRRTLCDHNATGEDQRAVSRLANRQHADIDLAAAIDVDDIDVGQMKSRVRIDRPAGWCHRLPEQDILGIQRRTQLNVHGREAGTTDGHQFSNGQNRARTVQRNGRMAAFVHGQIELSTQVCRAAVGDTKRARPARADSHVVACIPNRAVAINIDRASGIRL